MKNTCLSLLLILTFSLRAQDKSQSTDSTSSLPPSIRKVFQEIIEDSLATANASPTTSVDFGLMVMNETRTRFGSSFYDDFYQQLSLQSNLGSATVVVKEEPFRGTTTRLIITVNESEVVQGILRPNGGEYIESLISNSVQRVSYYINNYQEVQESLDGEDLSGSGIY